MVSTQYAALIVTPSLYQYNTALEKMVLPNKSVHLPFNKVIPTT
jgi:hypothetical protein